MFNWQQEIISEIIQRLLHKRRRNIPAPWDTDQVVSILQGLAAHGAADDSAVIDDEVYYLFLDVHPGEWLALARSVGVRVKTRNLPLQMLSFILFENRIIYGPKRAIKKIWADMRRS